MKSFLVEAHYAKQICEVKKDYTIVGYHLQDIKMVVNADLSSIYSEKASQENSNEEKVKSKNHDKQIKLFNNLLNRIQSSQNDLYETKAIKEMKDEIFSTSAIYYNTDSLLWGDFLICIFKDSKTDEISSITLDKLGFSYFKNIDIGTKSKYYPAIENLSNKDKNSNVKKCIAVTLLRKFSELTPEQLQLITPKSGLAFDYDQTHAGDLASGCKLFTGMTPEKVGQRLVSSGFIQRREINSVLLDVIYENNEDSIEVNNRLVFHLGEQLEQLFDPVTEYSPEQTEYGYKSPENEEPTEIDDTLVSAICNELLQIQSNFTFNLVEFLQKFLITLRVRVLNDEIEGLSTVKLNRLFSPTIDEVTRINCIFLDSLKTALPFGSLEVLKACSVTIPYFYKAYTRHEAATKNFSKDIKLFLRNFGDVIPDSDIFTEMKIETIIKGPQEKLLKLKLIIDRLWQKKEWSSEENKKTAKKYYDNIVDTIDSFGKLDKAMSSYNTRVFTPSGKILTELAKGWPVELQYKWLKRRVVGVFDVIDTNWKHKRNLLVIFSDYIVFLSIIDYEKYYTKDVPNKPLISDILMNSLINEVPLPAKIPKLKVENYCYIDEVFVSTFDSEYIRFDAFKGENSFSINCQLPNSNSATVDHIADLIIKAKILEKDTAFHLFKASSDTILYSTAHELEAYNNERIKSKFALFLNIEPSKHLLKENNLQLAIFAKLLEIKENEDIIEFTVIPYEKSTKVIKLKSSEIVQTLIKLLNVFIPNCYSSIYSIILDQLMMINANLLTKIKKNDEKRLMSTLNESESAEPVILEQITSENRKSYGTITTFRSHKSDLKIAEEPEVTKPTERDIKTSTDNNTKKQNIKKVVNQKSSVATVGKTTKVKNNKKRKSFFGSLKGIFGKNNKNKAVISKPVINSNQSKKVSLNSKINEKNVNLQKSEGKNKLAQSRNETKTRSKDALTIQNASTTNNDDSNTNEQHRISSVVRNVKYGQHPIMDDGLKQNSEPVMKDISRDSTTTGSISHETNPYATLVKPIPNKQNIEAVARNIETNENIPAVANRKEDIKQVTENSEQVVPTKVIVESEQEKIIPDKVLSKGESKEEKKLQMTDVDTSVLTQSTMATRDRLNTALNSNHQSGIFNDDLFGDFNSSTKKQVDHKEPLEQKVEENNEKISMNIISKHEDTISDKESDKETDNETVTTMKELSKDGEVTHDLVDTLETSRISSEVKQKIFPDIVEVPQQTKINFETSPSLIELFEGMRVVLDDFDAKYNWKRLPSDKSLNEKLLVNQDREPVHMFNQISETMESDDEQIEVITIRDDSRVDAHNSCENSVDIQANYETPVLSDSSKTDEQTVLSDIEGELNNVVGNAFDTVPHSKSGTSNKSGNFKVIHSSPVRYINKENSTHEINIDKSFNTLHVENTQGGTGLGLTMPEQKPEQLIVPLPQQNDPAHDITTSDSNIISEFSFNSDINNETDRRWHELSFVSHDDAIMKKMNESKETLDEGKFITPSETPIEMFSDQETDELVNSTLNGENNHSSSNANQSNEETAAGTFTSMNLSTEVEITDTGNTDLDLSDILNKSNGIDNSAVLDNLDFSSFHMSFDTSAQTDEAENSSVQRNDILNSITRQNLVWNSPQKSAEKPVIYRLSRTSISGVNLRNEPDKENNEEDDPIWVSPSKIDFVDLSRIPNKLKSPTKNVTETYSSNIPIIRNNTLYNKRINSINRLEESILSTDSSFAFLASLVNTDDVELSDTPNDNGPTRLKFT